MKKRPGTKTNDNYLYGFFYRYRSGLGDSVRIGRHLDGGQQQGYCYRYRGVDAE
jgi:hypothetical protein